MPRIQTREFTCDVYHSDALPTQNEQSELYISTTVAFRVSNDGRIRQLTAGENQHITELTEEKTPERTDTLKLRKYDNDFYRENENPETVTIGTHYLVDGETVITPVTKTNIVKNQGPIKEIGHDDFSPDHVNIYVIKRDNPFGRFRYRANRVRRFIKSDRVTELVPVTHR